MKNRKILSLAPVLGLLYAGAAYWNAQHHIPVPDKKLFISEITRSESIPATDSKARSALSFAGGVLSEKTTHSARSNNTNPAIKRHLPGMFRGDWGPTPVYAKNDRVHFERGAYLSLANGNQNQPPAASPGYWRLLKKFKPINQANCFSPAPGVDMAECDFTGENALKDLNLQGADLTKTRLNGELGAADLTGANLSGAAIFGSLVIGPDTRLENANLSNLQSDGNNPVIAENANLAHTDFTKANLYGAQIQHTDLSGATLREVVLTGSQLAASRFDNTDLVKSDLAYANLSSGSLKQAVMTEANLEQSDLSHADLSQANLQKAVFAGSRLDGADFSGADLRGVNFSGAQGADTAVIDRDTDFTAAVCPDGATVDGTHITTCVGHGF